MPFADLKSFRLRYELTGDPGLPVLTLSNALGAGLEMWELQLAVLSHRFRVLRYDTRGIGASSLPRGPYSIDQLGGDVLELLDLLGIEKAHFCGVSMGGLTGQWLGIHAPERVISLVLAATAAKIGTVESWDARIATVRAEGVDVIVSGTMERWFTEGFRARKAETVASIAAMLQSNPVEGYVANCAAVRDSDFRDSLHLIDAPVLIVSGSHDVSTTVLDGRLLAGQIAGSRFLEINAAHLCNVEAADEFNAAVLEFLSQ